MIKDRLDSVRCLGLALVAAIALILGGCGGSSSHTASETVVNTTTSAAATVPPPSGAGAGTLNHAGALPSVSMPAQSLAPGDKVKVVVFREEQLSGEFEIDSNGRISMPLIGSIDAAGKPASDLEAQITAKLKAGYLRDPKVSVLVSTFRPIYVLGEVKNAGEYPFKSGLNVVSAVALAGGYSYRANTSVVYVRRANDTMEREVPAAPNVLVYPGDLVRVGERYF